MQETEPAQDLDTQPAEPEPQKTETKKSAGRKQEKVRKKVEAKEGAKIEAKEGAQEGTKEEAREETKEGEQEKKHEERKTTKPRRARARTREPEPAKLARRSKRNAARAYQLPEELTAGPPGRHSLRIVSANLRNGMVDPKAFAELVTALRADVVALQEAGRAHFEALAPELPHGEFEAGPGNSGLGIALRRPATPGRIEVVWRGARQMTLDPPDWPELQRPLDVVNVHIAPPHLYKPPLYGFVVRDQQVRALENHFKSTPDDDAPSRSRATVLIGDFNATPLWPVYRRIASQFTDAAIAVAQVLGRAVEPTWSLPAHTRRRLRIDHAFVRGVTPTEFQAVRVAGSDHSAIVVDITDRTN